jgi:hypothetical protein
MQKTLYDISFSKHDPDDFSPRTREIVRLVCVAVLAVIATLAVMAVVNPMPNSPLGIERDRVEQPGQVVVGENTPEVNA